jgi:predicted secreted protein
MSPGWTNISPKIHTFTEKDQGRTLSLRVGEKLVLNLRNPASGGYNIVTPVYDPHILKLVSRKDIPPKPAPVRKLGDFGQIIFEWEAIDAGETDLTVNISREWEVKKQPLEYLKVKIRVLL